MSGPIRRHSIAVGCSGGPKLREERRGSFHTDLENLTKSMSAGLNLLQRRLSRDKFTVAGSDTCLDKAMVQTALARHCSSKNIKVGKWCIPALVLSHFPWHKGFNSGLFIP